MTLKFSSLAIWTHRRFSLWLLLLVLVVALMGLLVWLAGRYESSLVQNRLEDNAAEAALDILSGLSRNVQAVQALHVGEPGANAWEAPARQLLQAHREILQLEWRSEALGVNDVVETPFLNPVFEQLGRSSLQADVALVCTSARRISGPAYSTSYFLPQPGGLGMEVIDLCLPLVTAGRLSGYAVATYSLQGLLSELVGKSLLKNVGLSLTEADGTRLALYGTPARASRIFVARQLLNLPGSTMVVRMESQLGTPALFPNVLTALVSALSLALLAVLFLLGRDMRRRLQVEHDLGEALAFRKAMEDSLLTGLRARDLQGRITYVNPAFCKMVGVDAKELLNQSMPSPYWPPELASVYQRRQEIRLAGNQLPREGHESVFMRKDGTRFAVLIIEAPLINAVGKHTGWMSAILDISEQRRTEELSRASQDRLQASARLAMVGEMASLLSHELNQPLAAISSYATGSLNLLQHALAGDHAHEALALRGDLQLAMRRIAEQAERAGKVIKSVHDFVRRSERVREAVKPQALLDAIMPLMSLQARKLDVRIDVEVDAVCPPVLCDRTMVEQVLLNLARNGMQAMQASQAMQTSDKTGSPAQEQPEQLQRMERVLTLRIWPATTGLPGQWVEFAVIDQGEGISGDVARQLFTPFFTTKKEGMGLGLSLCRTVIEQHGGFLGYENARPRGTIFSFTLPTAALPATGAILQNALEEV